jgi:hypothetical protein
MTDVAPRRLGTSGDFGWGDSDEAPATGMNTALFLLVSFVHWGLLWLSGAFHVAWRALPAPDQRHTPTPGGQS